MVDINLLGDDQTRYEGEDSTKDFQESYEPELNEPAPSSYMSSGHIDDADYTKALRHGGSKKLIYILAALSIVILAVAAWMIIKPSKTTRTAYEPPPSALSELENAPVGDTSRAYNLQPDTTSIATVSLSPGLKEKIVKSHHGINTVSNIMNTIPANVNFTMITYSDGPFLVEFLAAGDADINNVYSQLQQGLYSADVKLVSKENRTIQNRLFRQALVNGTANMTQSGSELANPQAPAYLNATALQNQMSTISQQTGLTLKEFNAAQEKAEGEFMILPIIFKAVGQKSNILSFLQQLNAANLNISFAKISLIANEANLTDPKITLILNIGLYRQI